MKKAFILFTIFVLSGCAAYAADNCCNAQKYYDFDRDYRCAQLINKIRFQRNTLYNVLGLSDEQEELKDEIETRRHEAMQEYKDTFEAEKKKLRLMAQTCYNSKEYKQQRKITQKAWKKLDRGHRKFDREFMKILCRSQRAKYKEIVRLTRRDIRYCYLNHKSCPKDPYINTFGKNDAKPLCNICPKHEKAHLFNRTH